MALSLPQLARRADLIVRGTVRHQAAEWRDTLIYTVSTVEVAATFKGVIGSTPNGRTIRVAQLGGVLGRDAMPIEGAAPLAPGEQVVLFLLRNRQQPGEYYLAGMSQGKLGVVGPDHLLWAPTAPLWQDGALHEPRARRVSTAELRDALRGDR